MRRVTGTEHYIEERLIDCCMPQRPVEFFSALQQID